MTTKAREATKSKAVEKLVGALDFIYQKAVSGAGVDPSIAELARDYVEDRTEGAIDSLIKWQVGKAATAGFITGLGGIFTLPLAIPANFASVLYIQLRMVAVIAQLRGYDIRSDQVKTMAFACLCGSQFANIMKEAGVDLAGKLVYNLIMKIPGELLKKINRQVGFRLITKAGTTGVINLAPRVVPVFGGMIIGTVDGVVTRSIGRTAKSVFEAKASGG